MIINYIEVKDFPDFYNFIELLNSFTSPLDFLEGYFELYGEFQILNIELVNEVSLNLI